MLMFLFMDEDNNILLRRLPLRMVFLKVKNSTIFKLSIHCYTISNYSVRQVSANGMVFKTIM